MKTITKEHARKIAKKLGAIIDTTPKAHDIVTIFHKGVRIASFGIRRGSKKNAGHGHIPVELSLSRHDTLRLANCTLSKDEWIQMLIDEGHIKS